MEKNFWPSGKHVSLKLKSSRAVDLISPNYIWLRNKLGVNEYVLAETLVQRTFEPPQYRTSRRKD